MKGDNDLTKLARWIIPGWVVLLSFALFLLLDFLFSHTWPITIDSEWKMFLQSIDPISGILAALILAIAGVPLGFIIYQIYYFLRWNSPFARDGLLPPFFPGRMDELKDAWRDIPVSGLERGGTWRRNYIRSPLFEWQHSYRAWYQESLFFEAVQKLDSTFSGASIYSRYRYLHEIMHTLGASLVALYLAFSAYVFVKFYLDDIPLTDYLFVTALITGSYFFLQNLEYHRINETQKTAKKDNAYDLSRNKYIPTFTVKVKKWDVLFVSPAVAFVVALLFVHLWANPTLNLNVPSNCSWAIIWKYIVHFNLNILFKCIWNGGLKYIVSVAIIVSFLASKKLNSAAMAGDVIILGVAFIVAVAISKIPALVTWIDWPFFVALYAFLLGNLILFNNRRNAKEQSLAMQYYTLRRYITEKQHEN